jgi:outer membrane receptor protein involved in Fe transport
VLEAQVAAPPSTEVTTLARYDKNRNGVLDPDEQAAAQADAAFSTTGTANTKEEAIVLSPFEVTAETRGYAALNTMAGTRLNSRLEDLSSAISVVTKEQMADFAMLDINDVFLYGTNTEGTGTFTDMIEGSGNGGVMDNVAGDPANANRVRGIGNANVSNGNFETSNRVPIDPIDADGIEISRGPNANIFGLGNAAGTVNIVSATANLQRSRGQVAFRADSFDGHRSSFDFNRVLAKNRLAFRVNAVRQHDGFDLKPSGVNTLRYNGMVTFKPFRKTTINASYQFYRAHGNRPNSIPPQDAITAWREAGSPTWDPPTSSMKINGVVTRTTTPAYLYDLQGYAQFFIDRDGVKLLSAAYGVTGDTPLGARQLDRKLVVTRSLVQDAQPLIARRVSLVTDRNVYDWKSININAPNYFDDKTETSRVIIDQTVFESRRQSLAAQLGWFREDSERFNRYIMANGETAGPTGQLVLDVNERLLDGSTNPFFMRPLMAQVQPRPLRAPLRSDTFRGQFAYKLDFTSDSGWRRWLGSHALVGYAEYKDRVQRSYRFVDGIASRNPWLYADATANRSNATAVRSAFRYYVGDNVGQNVDYAPGNYQFGRYTYVWGDAVAGNIRREEIELGEIPFNSATGTRTIQRTGGVILQSNLLQGRLIPTVGMRKDGHSTRFQNPTQLTDRGSAYDYEFMNQWRPGGWQYREGRTEQRGVVVKPLRGSAWLERRTQSAPAIVRAGAHVLTGLSLHYNESDSFKPAAPAQNVFFEWLPDPGGKGKDYGFSLSLLDGKLGIRVNKYETLEINSRSGASAGFARAMLNMDYNNTTFGLQQEATEWLTEAAAAQGRTLTTAELEAALTQVMGVPPRNAGDIIANTQSETDNLVSRGHEVEIDYNPTRFWTVRIGFTEKQAINSRLAPNVTLYAAARMPYWTSIIDPRTGTPWWTTNYGGAETPFQLYRRTIDNPLRVARATEGLSRPQLRRYGGNISTNFRLAGITEHTLIKRFNVGGALRYESKGSIGYYGLQQLPDIITDYDINRPIWDKARFYADAFIGYRTRLWSDRVGATFQLNVRNIQEGGRLQPLAAFPDGRPYHFRIVSPRQFILSATFDL